MHLHVEKGRPMLHTRFCDRFGIEHPIVNAPKGDCWAAARLAPAVFADGGLGLIGGQAAEVWPDQADWLRAEIRAVRSRTARPFGVGFCPALPAGLRTRQGGYRTSSR